MNKQEMINLIASETGVSKAKTRQVVERTFESIIHALVTERRIEFRNFGVFEVKKRNARNTRNPQTGELMAIPERFFVNFKAGKDMDERVKRLQLKSVSEAIEDALDKEQTKKAEQTKQTKQTKQAEQTEPPQQDQQ